MTGHGFFTPLRFILNDRTWILHSLRFVLNDRTRRCRFQAFALFTEPALMSCERQGRQALNGTARGQKRLCVNRP
jgi:hypothetical protein